MGKIRKVPFEIKNEVVGNKTVLTLSGVVAIPYPWEKEDDTINEKLIRNTLDGVEGDILIRLNSPGGDSYEGVSICNYLKSLKNHVTVEVTGLAASAASIIAMGADKVVMDIGSNLMIHQAAKMTYGNIEAHNKSINMLDSVNKSITSIYRVKTGLDIETLDEMLNNETWFTAEEAVEKGFADEIGNAKVEEESEESDVTDKYEDAIKNLTAKVDALMNKQEPVVIEEKPKTNLLNQFLGGI